MAWWSWILLLLLIGVIGILSLFLWLELDLRSSRKRVDEGWEMHPCKKPNHSHATVGQVWKCRCGRRWQITKIERYRHKEDEFTWKERTPEMDLAEAQEALRKVTEQETDQ